MDKGECMTITMSEFKHGILYIIGYIILTHNKDVQNGPHIV